MPDSLYLFMGISNVVIALTSLVAGVVVFFKNKNNIVNITFVFFSVFMTFWAALYFFPFFPKDSYMVLLSERLLHIPANFIAVAHLHFICAFLGIHKQKIQKRIIIAGYLVSAFFLIFIPSTLFLKDAVPKPPLYFYPNVGILYHFWLVFWLSLIAYSVYLLFAEYKKTDGIKKQQIRYVLMGDIVTFSTGSTNFLLVYGLPIPPMFNIFTLAQTLAFVYVILRYKTIDVSFTLMNDVKQVVATSLAFVTAYIVFKIRYPQIYPVETIILEALVIFLIFQIIAKVIKSENLYKLFRISDYAKLSGYVNNFRNKRVFYPSVEALQNDIESDFVKKMGIQKAFIMPIKKSDQRKYPHLLKYFKNNNSFIVVDELELKQKATHVEYPYYKEVKSLGSVCFPLYLHKNQIIGLFVLGSKPFNNPYFDQELELLKAMSNYLALSLAVTLYNKRLQQEVASKTKALKKEIAKNRVLISQQIDFIAVTAHEFRTPLSIAKFQLEDLMDRELKHPKLSADIKIIENSIKDVVALTQTLFDVQQYDLKKAVLNVNKIDIIGFLFKICEKYQPVVHEKSKTLKFKNMSGKKEIIIKIDEQKLNQVIQNIVDNGLKFANDIRIEIYDETTNVLVKIIDNGPGIPDSKKTKVFEKFQTMKSSKAHGIGLGLYLCSKIIKLHKGEIWVEDAEQGGSVFCIELRK